MYSMQKQDTGDLVIGSVGVRKVRWATDGRGNHENSPGLGARSKIALGTSSCFIADCGTTPRSFYQVALETCNKMLQATAKAAHEHGVNGLCEDNAKLV